MISDFLRTDFGDENRAESGDSSEVRRSNLCERLVYLIPFSRAFSSDMWMIFETAGLGAKCRISGYIFGSKARSRAYSTKIS